MKKLALLRIVRTAFATVASVSFFALFGAGFFTAFPSAENINLAEFLFSTGLLGTVFFSIGFFVTNDSIEERETQIEFSKRCK